MVVCHYIIEIMKKGKLFLIKNCIRRDYAQPTKILSVISKTKIVPVIKIDNTDT